MAEINRSSVPQALPLANHLSNTQVLRSMAKNRLRVLPHRGVIAVAGEDRVAFLQGLLSNDVTKVAPGHAVWAALLTPQDVSSTTCVFVVDAGFGTPLLETERERAAGARQEARTLQVALQGDGRGSQRGDGRRRRVRPGAEKCTSVPSAPRPTSILACPSLACA
jgi:hypothetical protein